MRTWEPRREDVPGLDDLRRLEAALDTLAGPFARRNRALVRLLVRTGLRRAEAAALRVEDLHLREEAPYLVVQHGKGDKRREVPVDSDLAGDLLALVGLATEGPVFPSRRGGGCITGGQVERIVVSLRQTAGLPHLHAHALRHGYATAHVMAGTELHAIGAYLGHSKLTTTQTYLHVAAIMAGSDAERLRTALSVSPRRVDLDTGTEAS